MCDDLLDNGRSDLWFWHWRRWGRRRGRRGRWGGRSLLFTPDDDLVSYNLSIILGWRFRTWTADNELLALPGNQVAAIACWGRKAPLATSDGQGASFPARVSAITAELSTVRANLEIAVPLLKANGASFGGNVPAMATDFAARSVEVDVAATAASEAHVVVVNNLTRGRPAN
jgi:hypothetical protein